MSRPNIPTDTQNRVLYRNAWRCCVCRNRRQVQIHHIDKDPKNNEEANLAVICLVCHGEAHSTHSLSLNLTPERIWDHKQRWEGEVKLALSKGMLPEFVPGPAVWTYINHERLPAVLDSFGLQYDKAQVQPFIEHNIVNDFGIPIPVIPPENGPGEPITIYDRIPFHCRAPLIAIYSRAIAQVILAANPIDFRELKSPDQIQALAQPGTLCFLHRGCRFRTEISRDDSTEIRHANASVAGVTVRFQVDTRLMFGNSAISNSFAGHRYVTALLFAKSLGTENRKIVLHCTPLAMGTGFLNRREPWQGP